MTFDKVMKFGGAALADGPAVERVCGIVRALGGERPVLVVSAHQGVTASLDELARAAPHGTADGDRFRIRHRGLLRQLGLDAELLDRYFAELASLLVGIRRRGRLEPGERDQALSYGERMSARIVAHALKNAGVPATPVDAFDLGLTTDSNHGAARPLPECRERVRRALLEVPGVPVVTGFLAKDRHGNLTTLGRNGSDLTAALVAEAIGAPELELWKAVGGIMTADPAIVPEARVLELLSFEDAAALAFHGAEILHPDALAPAIRAGVAVRLLDVRDPRAPGTVLDARARSGGPVGIASRRKIVRATSDESPDLRPALSRHGVEPAAFAGGDGRARIYLAAGAASERFLAEWGARALVERDLALVVLVGGAPREEAAGFPALEALEQAGVPVVESVAAPDGASRLVVVHESDLERAVRGIHAALFAPERAYVP